MTSTGMAASLDSLLETALAESDAQSGQDALVVALHASLLSEGFSCTALGDEVMVGNNWEIMHNFIFLQPI